MKNKTSTAANLLHVSSCKMLTRCDISRECAVLTENDLLLMLKSILCYPNSFYHLMYPVVTDDLPLSQ